MGIDLIFICVQYDGDVGFIRGIRDQNVFCVCFKFVFGKGVFVGYFGVFQNYIDGVEIQC